MTTEKRLAFRSRWERMLGKTESPIEGIFLENFAELALTHGYGVAKRVSPNSDTIAVVPQKAVDRYRADFLVQFFFFGSLLQLIVECDGHEWHEKSKAQAKRDKQRDRDLKRAGFEVFRFTGSEIVAAPTLCAWEVLDYIMDFQTNSIVRAFADDRRAA